MSDYSGYVEKWKADSIIAEAGRKHVGITAAIADAYEKSREAVRSIPAADVEPVVRGEWIEFDCDMNAYSCSACNEPQMFIEGNPEQNEYSFCPHCGAHMIVERSGSGE